MKYLKELIIVSGFLLGTSSLFSSEYSQEDTLKLTEEFTHEYPDYIKELSLYQNNLEQAHQEVESFEKKQNLPTASLKNVKRIIDEFYHKEAFNMIHSLKLGKIETVRFQSTSQGLTFACSPQAIDEWQHFLKIFCQGSYRPMKEGYFHLALQTSEDAKRRLKDTNTTLVAFVHLNCFIEKVDEESLVALANLTTSGLLDFPNKSDISLNFVKKIKERLKTLEKRFEIEIKESTQKLDSAKGRELLAAYGVINQFKPLQSLLTTLS